jgi:hypothetical protein
VREYTITADGIEVDGKSPFLNGVMVGRPTQKR